MPSNSLELAQPVVAVAGTYLLHSTILLIGVWLFVRIARIRSHALSERLWKTAAVLGLVTAPLQVMLGRSSPMLDVTLDCSQETQSSVDSHGTSRSDDSFTPAFARGHEAIDGWTSDTAAFRRNAPDDIEPLADFDRNIGEYECDVEDRIPPPDSRICLADDPLDDGRAALSHARDGGLGRIYGSQEPPQESRHLPGVAAQLRQAGVVSPPISARVVSATAVLIAGFAVCGWFMLAVRTYLFYRRCAGAREIGQGSIRRTLDRLMKRNSIRRRVRLLSSDVFHEPFAYGLARWTIVLPEGMEQRLGREELKALLAHELAHFVRGDVLWLWIGRVLCSCLAFQDRCHVLAERTKKELDR